MPDFARRLPAYLLRASGGKNGGLIEVRRGK